MEHSEEEFVGTAAAMRECGHGAFPKLEEALREAKKRGLDTNTIASAWMARERYAPQKVLSARSKALLAEFDRILHEVATR